MLVVLLFVWNKVKGYSSAFLDLCNTKKRWFQISFDLHFLACLVVLLPILHFDCSQFNDNSVLLSIVMFLLTLLRPKLKKKKSYKTTLKDITSVLLQTGTMSRIVFRTRLETLLPTGILGTWTSYRTKPNEPKQVKTGRAMHTPLTDVVVWYREKMNRFCPTLTWWPDAFRRDPPKNHGPNGNAVEVGNLPSLLRAGPDFSGV